MKLRTHEYALRGEPATTWCCMEADRKSTTLVVLCHGWHGKLVNTWGKLIRCYRGGMFTPATDLLFLGYNESPSSIDLLADWIADTVVMVYPNHRPHPRLARKYTKIVLVGHSLGSLAMRRAALVLWNKGVGGNEQAKDICANGQIILYAPPLQGVDWEQYFAEIDGKLGAILQLIRKAKEPVSLQLAKDSPYVRGLRSDTEAALKNRCELAQAHLVLGMSDKVVVVNRLHDLKYKSDTHETRSDEGHSSVCKWKPPDKDLELFRMTIETDGAAGV